MSGAYLEGQRPSEVQVPEPFLTKEQWFALSVLITGVCLAVISSVAIFSFSSYSLPFLTHAFSHLTLHGSFAIGFVAVVVTFIGSVSLYVMTKKREDERLAKKASEQQQPQAPLSKVNDQPPLQIEPFTASNPSSAFIKPKDPVEDPQSVVLNVEPTEAPKVEKWKENLNVVIKESRCNLENPRQPLAPFAFRFNGVQGQAHTQIPQMGFYSTEGFEFDNAELIVRLHPEQVQRLPKSVREVFGKGNEPTDCFLMIFSPSNETKGKSHRNISLHAMALPEYDLILGLQNFPQNLPGVYLDSRKDNLDDVDTWAQVGLWEPSGLNNVKSGPKVKEGKDTDYLELNKIKTQDICVHKPCFSPDNCAISLDAKQPASSFIMTAKFREKRVVLAAIYLQKGPVASFEGKTMQQVYDHLTTQQWFSNCKWLPSLFE